MRICCKGYLSGSDIELKQEGREQIFNPDDMLVLEQDGKFDCVPTMKLYQAIKESYSVVDIQSINSLRNGPSSSNSGRPFTLLAIICNCSLSCGHWD